ncbi:MAG: hypothetical protein ACI4J0_13115 [Huintestinicola sp.]|uniref:hypothetical protein n=1 Tax=Huintestinicola sp. TaxID=2981661 RepID=UPI003F0D56FF
MSINGIGNYSAYSNLFSGMYSKTNTYKNTASDLQALMKRVDEVRSPEYRKKIRSQLEGGTSKNSETGTVSSELKLSEAASDLKKKSAELSALSMSDIKDKDVLVKKVTAFAESYNSAVDAMGKSDSVDALRAGLSMTNTVKTYSGALSRIGVKVGSDNKLTVNEETLRAADDNAVSSMFGSSYSPVARVADKAEDIGKAAVNKAQTTAFRSMMYGDTGSSGLYSGYNTFASSFLGTFFDSRT